MRRSTRQPDPDGVPQVPARPAAARRMRLSALWRLIAVTGGLGVVLGLVAVLLRALVPPAVRVIVIVPALVMILYLYGRLVWVPAWRPSPRAVRRTHSVR